jgi:hypothetical protein
MATDIRIRYANTSGKTHEHITHLGNDAGTWKVASVIKWIEGGEFSFYTLEEGKRAVIAVRKTGNGGKYVQTHADGFWKNNLLVLPPCKVKAA